MTVDIAAVVNLHREGQSAVVSITSAWRAVARARRKGLSAGLFLLLDDADEATLAVAERWETRGATVHRVTETDLGAARNRAVELIDTNWFAFLDADDLWGEYWLTEAHAIASTTSTPEPVVWHPAVNVIFGDHHSLLHHVSSTAPDFSWSRLRMHNMWTALSVVDRRTLLAIPYPRNELATGFGYEDWAWNIAILDHGGRHEVVPGTCHFIRRTNDDSLLRRSRAALRSRPPRDGAPGWRSTQAARPSTSAAVTPDDHTHTDQPVELDDHVVEQIRLAATIEPQIERTIRGDGQPRILPQNRQTHVLAAHVALDELETIATTDRALSHTSADIIAAAEVVHTLSSEDRARVIAEFVVEERRLGRPEGSSTVLDEAYDLYPQISA